MVVGFLALPSLVFIQMWEENVSSDCFRQCSHRLVIFRNDLGFVSTKTTASVQIDLYFSYALSRMPFELVLYLFNVRGCFIFSDGSGTNSPSSLSLKWFCWEPWLFFDLRSLVRRGLKSRRFGFPVFMLLKTRKYRPDWSFYRLFKTKDPLFYLLVEVEILKLTFKRIFCTEKTAYRAKEQQNHPWRTNLFQFLEIFSEEFVRILWFGYT